MSPLRREVEPPRPTVGPWLPVSLLGTTFVLVLAMGIAVTAERPSRVGQTMKSATANSAHGPTTTRATSDVAAANAVAAHLPQLSECMLEWSERSQQRVVTLGATLDVRPDGTVDELSTTGTDDRILPTCIATVLRAAQLPSSTQPARFVVDLRFIEGQTRVATHRQY